MLMCAVSRLIHSIHTHDGSEEQSDECKEGLMMGVAFYVRILQDENLEVLAFSVDYATMFVPRSQQSQRSLGRSRVLVSYLSLALCKISCD